MCPSTCPTAPPYLYNYEGGNVDLRVPYIGYAAESIGYKAAGVDAYNALQAHIEKRMSKGIQVGASYTYSHALDEQSGWDCFTTATMLSTCAAGTAQPTLTAPTSSTLITFSKYPTL